MKCYKAALLGLAVALLLTGCGKKPGEQERRTEQETETAETESTTQKQEEGQTPAIAMEKEEYPVIDGSTATLPLSYLLYQRATGASEEEAMAEIAHTKTTNAYFRLMNKEADLLIVYEASDAVWEKEAESGVKLELAPIGKDALVFMRNTGNPVTSLTEEQLRDIYSGVIQNWKEVGGEEKEIIDFQRPENSGSQTLMEKLVMKGTPMEDAPVTRKISSMGAILEQVASYQNSADALGYSVYYYARNMYEIPGLAFMSVNGVAPDRDTIYDGSYPFINSFYAVIREDEPENSKARLLYNWLIGEDGQKLVEEAGYVPAQ